jgi:hypothetical protein
VQLCTQQNSARTSSFQDVPAQLASDYRKITSGALIATSRVDPSKDAEIKCRDLPWRRHGVPAFPS